MANINKLGFYCECQKCGWKKNLKANEMINLNHECEYKD